MGGGGIKDSQNTEKSIAAQQQATSQQTSAEGQDLINKGQSEQDPLVNFLRGIIGGNSTTTNQALAPVIGNITAGTKASKENIMDSTAPGAARDYALAENQRNQGTQVAQATNSTFLSAFPELAALSGGNTNAGLGLTGAGITSLSNSATTTGNVLQSQEQQKASQMSIIGDLAGAAGTAAGGGAFGKL